ncbi:Crp/Fnr family transcriptional regulator [Portibacter lacus]|uniref:Cyclic nucleotide-binding protein n=1 Tax=Portibacter lacus TaxID=1099794 RepID=A0AA37WEH1_9BACT|nr:Crp/Fnr family transcriptional regulator [Portibacter lacus]GLR16020.1 cyclic nucleotide-binding protein [Portibacter lacus]
MEQEIFNYLSKYTTITEELVRAITESTYFQSYPKGSILLKEGSIAHECYFILKGCIRSYLLKDGEEITIEFYTEEQVVSPASYGKSIPSDHYLECLEDVVVSVGNPELEKETFRKYPSLASLSLVIAEVVMKERQESFTSFKTSTPEERYLNLLSTRPDLIQRVAQQQIASYLGIKPESLSRIKKRIRSRKVSS